MSGPFIVVVRVSPEGYYVVAKADREETAKRWAEKQLDTFTKAGRPAEVGVWDVSKAGAADGVVKT